MKRICYTEHVKRFLHIDFLRAVAILAVIGIHVFSDNLINSVHFFIWNYLHFIIVAFVFCSGYVMYTFYAPKLLNVSAIFSWYKKRLVRLILPFYWYLLVHYILMVIFPKFFTGLGLQLSPGFVIQSVTLVGGISLNWLPLLFLELAILFPLLVLAYQKKKILFWVYILFAILTTIGFTIWQFPYSQYRWVMWIPWSLILVLAWWFVKKEWKKVSNIPYFTISAIGMLGFLGLFVIWTHLGRSVTLIDNKYPPNLFYISYEVFGSFLLLGISFWHFLQKTWVVKLYTFLSRVSYSLFFIHYIVMDFALSVNKLLGGHVSVWYQLIFVLGVSIFLAYTLSKILTLFAAK